MWLWLQTAAPATVSLGTGIDRCNRQEIKIVVVVVFFCRRRRRRVWGGHAGSKRADRLGGGSCVVCVGAASCWRKVKRRCASHPLPPEADCRSPAQPTQMTSATSGPSRCRTIHSPPPNSFSLSAHYASCTLILLPSILRSPRKFVLPPIYTNSIHPCTTHATCYRPLRHKSFLAAPPLCTMALLLLRYTDMLLTYHYNTHTLH